MDSSLVHPIADAVAMNVFSNEPNYFPSVKRVGDIICIHDVKVQVHAGSAQLTYQADLRRPKASTRVCTVRVFRRRCSPTTGLPLTSAGINALTGSDSNSGTGTGVVDGSNEVPDAPKDGAEDPHNDWESKSPPYCEGIAWNDIGFRHVVEASEWSTQLFLRTALRDHARTGSNVDTLTLTPTLPLGDIASFALGATESSFNRVDCICMLLDMILEDPDTDTFLLKLWDGTCPSPVDENASIITGVHQDTVSGAAMHNQVEESAGDVLCPITDVDQRVVRSLHAATVLALRYHTVELFPTDISATLSDPQLHREVNSLFPEPRFGMRFLGGSVYVRMTFKDGVNATLRGMLQPGVWLRLRNLSLYKGVQVRGHNRPRALAEVAMDTHVTPLRPYFKYELNCAS